MSAPSIQELREWVDKNVDAVPSDALGGYSPRSELRSALDSLSSLVGTARAFRDEGDRIVKEWPEALVSKTSKPRESSTGSQNAGK